MQAAQAREEAFRLHTDDRGNVWYGRDNLPAIDSGLTADAFVVRMALPLKAARNVRIVGCRGNARLIVAAGQLRQLKGNSGGFLLAAPATFGRGNPADILHRLWQPDLSCCIAAGYHDMTQGDFTSYLVADAIDEARGPCEKARRVLRYHPAWPALSFLPTLNDDAACKLIAEVLDPRWFRHHVHPNRLSRLNAFMGLTRQNVAAYLNRKNPAARHSGRFACVADCWFKNVDKRTRAELPCNFLLRVVRAARDPIQGMLKACARLVRFVCEVWLAGLGGRYEFLPDLFFNDDEIDAYYKHLQQASRVA